MSVFKLFIEKLVDAPETQISQRVQERISRFSAEQHTELECYDFLDGIANEPGTEISDFVRTFCDVSKFYDRPQ